MKIIPYQQKGTTLNKNLTSSPAGGYFAVILKIMGKKLQQLAVGEFKQLSMRSCLIL